MVSIRQSVVAIGFALALTPLSLHAQPPQIQPTPRPQTTLVLPAGPLLPEKFGAWQRVGNADEQTNVAATALAGAKIFAEDGAQRSSIANYQPAAGGAAVRIDAIEFTDASGAYSAFTWWASRQQRSTGVKPEGEQATIPGEGFLFRAGTVLVMVHDAGVAKQIQTQLSAVLPKTSGPKGQIPLVPTILPSHGLVLGSVRYALGVEGFNAMDGRLPGAIVGFDKSAEVVTADYSGRGTRATLTVALYPTPQIAGEKGRAVEAAINADRPRFGKTVKMRRDGTLVAFASGDLSESAADALVKAANLHEELSWNHAIQPEVDFNAEIHKTATLLQKIVVFCVVVGAGTILLGLFLGFGRAGVRVLMGKPAAVEPEFLGINLRGIPPGRLDPSHPEGPTDTPPSPPLEAPGS